MPWGPPSPLALRLSSSGRLSLSLLLLLLLLCLFCFHSLSVLPPSLCLSVRPAPCLRILLSGALVLKSLDTRHLWCFILVAERRASAIHHGWHVTCLSSDPMTLDAVHRARKSLDLFHGWGSLAACLSWLSCFSCLLGSDSLAVLPER